MSEAGFNYIYPYHFYLPSFGDWGIMMGSFKKRNLSTIKLKQETRYLNNKMISSLFSFSKDMLVENIQSSQLDHPRILSYYLKGWRKWQ